MISSVNFCNTASNIVPSLNSKNKNRNCSDTASSCKNVAFGDSEYPQSPFQGVKDTIANITNGFVGLIGVNAAIWALQDLVNGKLLVGKINKHFTSKINDEAQITKLASEMWHEKGLDKGEKEVHFYTGAPEEAYYTHVGNERIKPNSIVTGKNTCSSLFHELGHAVEENNTKFFKLLQRGRGNYTILALGLYTLMSQDKKNDDFSDAAIPLLAFSPELITEGKASMEGLKFLKEKIGKASPLYKNIRSSYLTCFLTYLFVPLSIIIVDGIRNEASKAMQRRQLRKEGYYS